MVKITWLKLHGVSRSLTESITEVGQYLLLHRGAIFTKVNPDTDREVNHHVIT